MNLTNGNKVSDLNKYAKIIRLSGINILEYARKYENPKTIGELKFPDLDELTFGQLAKLWEIDSDSDILYKTGEIVFGINKSDIDELPLIDYLQFVDMCVQYIVFSKNKFNDIQRPELTPEEKSIYGTIDDDNPTVSFVISFLKSTNTPVYPDKSWLEIGFNINWLELYYAIKKDSEQQYVQRELSKQK